MKPSRLAARLLLPLLLATGLLLAGCGHKAPPPWQLTSIRGHMPDLAFKLTDDTGKTVTAADFKGKVVLLYFGYTHCPDICPLTMAHLHQVMQKLGKQAADVRILFVTVDPARDTPQVLHDYVHAFDSHAIGLTGSPGDIETVVKRYRASFTRIPDKHDSGYEVSHSSGIYIFDRSGRARLLATPANTQGQLVHDLSLLIGSGQ
ncbi:SCO family protein [Dyella sp. A6]|uniref:SCO family protein n=1 Tax=Dyella aluminiiresistens TaxID=3069105 RepID=UPI002E7957CA|nr:SCO family protein [Dyella sp. A6]